MSALLEATRWFLVVLGLGATAYVALQHLVGLVMLLVASRQQGRQQRFRLRQSPDELVLSPELPGISVLIPAFNEEASIVRTVESVLGLRHPDLEVVVVSDGSTDGTLGALARRFELALSPETAEGSIPTQRVRSVFRSRVDPRLVVLDKRNGGKADALNVGINFASRPLACVTDADVVLDPWALLHLSLPFLEDASVVASSGTIRLQNGCRIEGGRVVEAGLPTSLLGKLQVIEYLRAFGLGRLFFDVIDAHILISGAFGLFRRSVLVEIGGFQPNAIGEDMELVLRLHRVVRPTGRAYRIRFVGDAICFTEAPHSLRELGKQRTRWHQGLLTSLRVHREMMLSPRFGAVGLVALPYFLWFELLAPVFEAAGWLFLPLGVVSGLLAPSHFFIFIGVSLVFGSATSVAAILIDDRNLGFFPRFRQILALCLCAPLEHFGYHQATLFFRLRAFVRYYGAFHLRGGWVSPARQARVRS